MPIRFSPRFGPFRYEAGRRNRFHTLWYWLVGVWALEIGWWVLVGVYLTVAWLWHLATGRRR